MHGSRCWCAGNRGAFASTPGAFSSAPPSSSQAGLDAIDSKGYLMDILNLSVDLDPDDEDDVSMRGGAGAYIGFH